MTVVDRFVAQVLERTPDAVNTANQFRAVRDAYQYGLNCPAWVDISMRAVGDIILFADLPGSAVEQVQYTEDLTAVILWLRSKMLYSFDSILADTLYNQQFEGDVPTDALMHMPFSCIFVAYSSTVLGKKCGGFFAWKEWDSACQWTEIQFLYIFPDCTSVSFSFPLVGGTLESAMEKMIESAKKGFFQLGLDANEENKTRYDSEIATYSDVIPRAINLLLYLCAAEADVPDYTELRKRRTYDSNRNAKRAVTWTVGERIGAAIRGYKLPKEVPPSESDEQLTAGTHNSPRPHMRRAHWHHYWIGSRDGERALVLKWIPPVPVNADFGGENPTVIKKVKKGE
jgi:hypothetical protein